MRVLLALALLQAALIYLPPLVWAHWLAHFVALELCFLGVATGLGGAALASEPCARGLGIVLAIACALPGFAVAPAYVREGQAFSVLKWLGWPEPKVPVERDVAFGSGLLADLYRPAGDGLHPWVVVVHGGSWKQGDKGDAEPVSHALAGAGFLVVDMQYRFAPGHPFPAAVADVRCVVGTLQARAAEWKLDPARGAILGRSAGGQIALLAAYAGKESGIEASCGVEMAPVRAVVSIYGPVDLAWAHANPFVPDVVGGPASIEGYLGGKPAEKAATYADANPITHVERAGVGGAPLPATLLIHGTAEHCVRTRNPERLRDALDANGRVVRTLFIPLADHGFDLRRGGLGEQLSRGVLLDFLRRELAAGG